MTECYHCGTETQQPLFDSEGKAFCCNGCLSVYRLLSSNGMLYYYELNEQSGQRPKEEAKNLEFLDTQAARDSLLEFDDDGIQKVQFTIPQMHCSSCIWILENLGKFQPQVRASSVNFPRRTVSITYSTEDFSLKQLVILLMALGYEPDLSMQRLDKKKKSEDRQLIYQIGVAGFAFGNVMLLSFPEYFEVEEYWLDQYKNVFRTLMLLFSLPVVGYAARPYFKSALSGLRSRQLNIDVPIALGVLAIFVRSVWDVVFDMGPGFFDSLTGLVFFLLLGRIFQQKTYSFLSFDRDYKSYFPLSVTRILENGSEENVPASEIHEGDTLLIRNNELIPVDAILMSGSASIDYSFVTGESEPVYKEAGTLLFAGGRQRSGLIELEAVRTVSQSYLTQLWEHDAFKRDKDLLWQGLTNTISQYFTPVVISIAIIASAYWFIQGSAALGWNVFTAVLIIACPCALALAGPFTWGTLLRWFSRHSFYIRNAQVLEQMAFLDTAVFDKTGTLTQSAKTDIRYTGSPLSEDELVALRSTLRASSHPLSRALYQQLSIYDSIPLESFSETVGQGLEGVVNGITVKVGSAAFVGLGNPDSPSGTSVYVRFDGEVKGSYEFRNTYREGVRDLFSRLGGTWQLSILSGDNDGERERLLELLPAEVPMFFNQKPEHKLSYVQALQDEGRKVLMVGDGLNDAGALVQSDLGVAITEDINVFSPASDAILKASSLSRLPDFLRASRRGVGVIRLSFAISFLYNVVGLGFAVTGKLEPVVAAILMPLSSISVVAFTTFCGWMIGRSIPK